MSTKITYDCHGDLIAAECIMPPPVKPISLNTAHTLTIPPLIGHPNVTATDMKLVIHRVIKWWQIEDAQAAPSEPASDKQLA